MDGCQYIKHSFTLPASHNTSQKKWDLVFMTREEFMEKYKISQPDYDKLSKA